MIVGMGLDLCAIEKGAQMRSKPHFMQRVFTEGERAYIASRGAGQDQTTAGLFAAKEAVLKALGAGIGDVALAQIEITHAQTGAPQVLLSGSARERLAALGGVRILITITHDGGMAAASAIAEGE